MSECPDENLLQRFCEEGLDEGRRGEIAEHIAACEGCLAELADIGRALAPETLPPGTRVGRYVLGEVVGRGAMGVVYAAHDPTLDRRVAVKLLRRDAGGADTELQARLQREAQALARLSHANVVTVFDVGLYDTQLFVAMELCNGVTLGEWMRRRPALDEILRVFSAAGQGLAAAHAAGLVHRDFKPDNVLVGDDGSVRVGDFGLALLKHPLLPADRPAPSSQMLDDVVLSTTLTNTGALVGTPAYMAPEQMSGGVVDARADVFSFAVALYEALHGERPFQPVKLTLAGLRDEILAGRVQAARAGVPMWLRRRVLAGLAAEPAARPASMQAFLATLADDPRRRTGRVVTLAAIGMLVAGALGGGFLLSRGMRQKACAGGRDQIETVWNDARRASLRAAFAKTGRGYAGDVANAVVARLDQYATTWADQWQDACSATKVRGEQSEQLLDLRMECLDTRRGELSTLVDAMNTVDATALDRAGDATARLPPVEACADRTALTHGPTPPAEAAARTQLTKARAVIAKSRTLLALGNFKGAAAAANEGLEAARTVHFRPIEAEAQLTLGAIYADDGKFAEAEAAHREAIYAAEAGRDDIVAARARVNLLFILALAPGRAAELAEADRAAVAAIERLGTQAEDLRAARENHLGNFAIRQGRNDEAIQHLRAAIDGFSRASGPDSPAAARALANLTIAMMNAGRMQEALPLAERALAIFEKVNGKVHPTVAVACEHLVGILNDLDRAADALPIAQRALAVREATNGPDHPDTSYALDAVAGVYRVLKRPAEALPLYQRELVLVEKSSGANSADVAQVLDGIGVAQRNLGHTAEARVAFTRALKIREAAKDGDPGELASSQFQLGDLTLFEGHAALALPLLRKAEAGLVAARGEDHPHVLQTRLSIGEAELARGNKAAAHAIAEKLVAVLEKRGDTPDQLRDAKKLVEKSR
jgi:tetratricopeptide (TPR) repeat protein